MKGREAAAAAVILILSSCSAPPPPAGSLAEALSAESRGETVRAREIYEKLLKDVGDKDADLSAALKLKIAALDWALHDEGRSLEAYDDLAKSNPDLALLALDRAASLQSKAGAEDQALETHRRVMELVVANPALRRAAADLGREALVGIEQDSQLGDLPAAAAKREAFFAKVPRPLLEAELLNRLEQVQELKAQADKLSQTTADQLQAGPAKSAAQVPEGVLGRYAKEIGDRTLSPDGAKVLVRRKNAKGEIVVQAGKVGGSLATVKGTKDASRPSWTRDSRGILFTRLNAKGNTRGVFVARLDGQAPPMELFRGGGTQIGYSAAWCPVADKVAFLYAGDLWVMDADGNNIHKVTAGLDLDRETPMGWSQDGTRLYFEPYTRRGKKAAKAGGIQYVVLGQVEELPT